MHLKLECPISIENRYISHCPNNRDFNGNSLESRHQPSNGPISKLTRALEVSLSSDNSISSLLIRLRTFWDRRSTLDTRTEPAPFFPFVTLTPGLRGSTLWSPLNSKSMFTSQRQCQYHLCRISTDTWRVIDHKSRAGTLENITIRYPITIILLSDHDTVLPRLNPWRPFQKWFVTLCM